MKLEVILTPAELPALAKRDLRNSVCVVFDVLRATSTIVTALHHGAKAVVPVSEIAEALAFKNSEFGIRNSELILLGGERDGLKICAAQIGGTDFDLGNSPRECTPERVGGRMIVSTTTNGTRALRACAGAKTVLAGSFLNLTATAEFIRRQELENVLLVCAGTHENSALEDVLAAGALIELLAACEDQPSPGYGATSAHPTLSDSAELARRVWAQAKSDLAGAVCGSQNARLLLAIPELRDDVPFCLQRDIFPLVAKLDADGIIHCIK